MTPVTWRTGIGVGLACSCLLLTPQVSLLSAQAGPAGPQGGQRSEDEYTRYELLAPGSASFRIRYAVTAATPGARFYWNSIRRGSEASEEVVTDPATGKSLGFTEVDGATARANGFATAELDTRYIQVELPRPVPDGGEVRVLIEKTYRDARSYHTDGDEIVFERSLGIRRNSIVLPAGYELTRCNVPSQVFTLPDGRIAVSFLNAGFGATALVVRGRRLGS